LALKSPRTRKRRPEVLTSAIRRRKALLSGRERLRGGAMSPASPSTGEPRLGAMLLGTGRRVQPGIGLAMLAGAARYGRHDRSPGRSPPRVGRQRHPALDGRARRRPRRACPVLGIGRRCMVIVHPGGTHGRDRHGPDGCEPRQPVRRSRWRPRAGAPLNKPRHRTEQIASRVLNDS